MCCQLGYQEYFQDWRVALKHFGFVVDASAGGVRIVFLLHLVFLAIFLFRVFHASPAQVSHLVVVFQVFVVLEKHVVGFGFVGTLEVEILSVVSVVVAVAAVVVVAFVAVVFVVFVVVVVVVFKQNNTT